MRGKFTTGSGTGQEFAETDEGKGKRIKDKDFEKRRK